MTDDDDPKTKRKWLAWLAARLRGRDDSEHEQILIRIGIAAIITVILGGIVLFGSPSLALLTCLGLATFLLLGALSFLGHLLWKPAVNPARRLAAMLLDIGCLSIGMILGDALMTPLYPLFLWVILGMGFRYGRRYLLISSVMGLLGFGLVIAVSPYWQAQPLLAGSLLLALAVLPAYTSTLLKKLTEARERAEEANRAKSRFLATMSHELRTPLNAIFGMASLLNADRLNPNQRDMVATMRSAGHTLLELIDDLLDVARIESGRLQPQRERFDLHVTLAVTLRLLRHQAMEKGLDLRARYDPDVPHMVIGTERWLKQILINLIGNAIKFTNEGEILLDVSVTDMSEDRACVVFAIADTGIGIAKEAQEQIFERFAQADNSTSRRHGGSGLGLSIARQLAEIMGGRLTVDSDVGKGARFRLELDLNIAPDAPRELSGRVAVIGDAEKARSFSTRLRAFGAETAVIDHPSDVFAYLENCGERRAVLLVGEGSPAASMQALGERLESWFLGSVLNQILIRGDGEPDPVNEHYLSTLLPDVSDECLFNVMHAALAVPGMTTDDRAAIAPIQGRRILVAEDNPINQKVVRKMLVSGGHSVVLAENGEALLDQLEEDDFDLILVDLNMPSMSGIDAVKLHRMGAGANHPPFIALTADATEETRRTCMDVGFTDFLTKPLERRDLLEVVDRHTRAGRSASKSPTPATKVIRHPRFADSQASLDVNHLSKLRLLDPDPTFLSEVIDDFIEDARGLIDELDAAVDSVDDIAYRDRSHALQSSAAYIGAIGLCQLCQQWRNVGPDQLRAEGAARVAQIRLEFQRLCTELRAILDDGGTADVSSKH